MKRILIISCVIVLAFLILQLPSLNQLEDVNAIDVQGTISSSNIEELSPPLDPIEFPEEVTIEINEVKETSITVTDSIPSTDAITYDSDAEILAKLLYGECRGVDSTQQKAAVVWCVLNRVDSSDTYYPNTIKGVITQKNHFTGYSKSNPVWPELLSIAQDVLDRWEKEKRGEASVGRVLPRDYLWFHGNGETNIFRNNYIKGEGDTWDWSLPNPYES